MAQKKAAPKTKKFTRDELRNMMLREFSEALESAQLAAQAVAAASGGWLSPEMTPDELSLFFAYYPVGDTGDPEPLRERAEFHQKMVSTARLAADLAPALPVTAHWSFCLRVFGARFPAGADVDLAKEVHAAFGVAANFLAAYGAFGATAGTRRSAPTLPHLSATAEQAADFGLFIFDCVFGDEGDEGGGGEG